MTTERGWFSPCVAGLGGRACRLTLAILVGMTGIDGGAIRADLAGFVRVDGTSLRDDAGPLRFVSFNAPNLLVVEDAFGFCRRCPWRWPDDFELDDTFAAIRQMGGTVTRTYVITVRRDDSDMEEFVHVRGPGDFNEEAFRAMDRMLAAAGRAGVRVIVPLVDNWKWQGGAPQYAGFRGKPPEAFWTDPEVIADFKATIRFLLTRRNTVTGLRYADDPAILGWETGNELDSPPAWTREIAATIKSLDPNHLVIDGNSLRGVPTASLAEPLVDVITTHHYPSDRPMAERVAEAIAATAGRKPFFVGEAGFVPLADMQDVVERVKASDAAGLLLWSIRPRNREGGFYWHSEPNNLGRYKAYHWPGFPSGSAYDETAVMDLVRQAAHAIRGLPLLPLPVPATPRMLPTDDVGAISWQGATGATQYRLDRGASASGPWETLCQKAREDQHPYRPLFADETAAIGMPCWYRVAAANGSGESAPSEPVGPIVPHERVFVDEFDDLSRVAEATTGVEIVHDNPRSAQEDLARACVPAGGRLTYRMPAPIRSIRLFVFATDPDQTIELVAAGPAGPQPIEVDRDCVGRSGGDYAYLTPLAFTARPAATQVFEVRVPKGGDPVQISRIEIRFGP